MFYYREINEQGENVGFCCSNVPMNSSLYIELDLEEYEALRQELEAERQSLPMPSYDELVEENARLEAENAALFFELMTGEVFLDDELSED